MIVEVARAFERDALVEAACPQCGTQLGGGRWDTDGARRVCTSCTGVSGVAFVAVYAATAAERAAIAGLLAFVVDGRAIGGAPTDASALVGAPAPRVWLDVDRAAFVAVHGDLVLTADRLAMAARSDDPRVRHRVVKHPAVTSSILDVLAGDVEVSIRTAVAAHERTPATALLLLAQDDDVEVRVRVAKHKDTPAAALTTLAADGSPKLRVALAAHDETPAAIVFALLDAAAGRGGDDDKAVLKALAGRSSPIDELTKRLKKLGYALKQPPKPPAYDATYDPNSGVSEEDWQRAVDASYRH